MDVDLWLPGFHEPNEEKCQCTIVSYFTNHLARKESFIYSNNLFGVWQEKKVEYRQFFNSDFAVYAELQDFGNRKSLYIKENTSNDLIRYSLLNHLALDKTMSEHGRLLLHASFIETAQGAVLFSAPSGTGKSTQAELWRRYRGAAVINGDRAGLWRGETGWLAGGVPWCGTSGISLNRILPLRAVVILRQGPENVLEVPLASEKLKALLEQTTINPWNREMYLRSQERLLDLIQSVPVVRLTCRPDAGAVELLAKELGL